MAAKTVARPRKAPRPVTAVAPSEFEPLRFVTPTEPAPIQTMVAFYIDDTAYSIPVHVSPSVGLRFIKAARTSGMELAMGELIEQLIGTEAYDALANYEHLTAQQFTDLVERIQRHAMGALDGPKAASRSA